MTDRKLLKNFKILNQIVKYFVGNTQTGGYGINSYRC